MSNTEATLEKLTRQMARLHRHPPSWRAFWLSSVFGLLIESMASIRPRAARCPEHEPADALAELKRENGPHRLLGSVPSRARFRPGARSSSANGWRPMTSFNLNRPIASSWAGTSSRQLT